MVQLGRSSKVSTDSPVLLSVVLEPLSSLQATNKPVRLDARAMVAVSLATATFAIVAFVLGKFMEASKYVGRNAFGMFCTELSDDR